MKVFILTIGLFLAMFICIGILNTRFNDQQEELTRCKQENDYYFKRLSKANYRIMLADSITKTQGILNPEDSTWLRQLEK